MYIIILAMHGHTNITGQFRLHVTNQISTETISAPNALGVLLCTKHLLTKNSVRLFLISNFCHVLNVVCFLLGNSPASEFYMPTFQNTLSVPSSYLPNYEDGTDRLFRNVGI